jgi:hypothetical protein
VSRRDWAGVRRLLGCEADFADRDVGHRILADLQAVEPLLRRIADHEIHTTMPPDEVVTAILRVADSP